MRKFLKVAIENFNYTGALFPSTHFAAETVVSKLPAKSLRVVEYGPGTGVITKALLKRMPRDAELLAVEMNQSFIEELGKIHDKRLKVVNMSALTFAKQIKDHFQSGADVVVSGIPFSFLPKEERLTILENTLRGLTEEGVLIIYQNTPAFYPMLKKVFPRVSLHIEPRNLPPYFILVAKRS